MGFNSGFKGLKGVNVTLITAVGYGHEEAGLLEY